MKRTNHNLSHYHMFSCDIGQLIPIALIETLPGDSIQMSSSALVRITPQLKPLMHPIDIRIHHFYVVNRNLWSGWEDHITGKSAGTIPTIAGGAHTEGDLSDYLGVFDDASNTFIALPNRGYNSIYNNYYRDKDIIAEVSEDQNIIQRIAWGKDYYTTARAERQQGTAVSLPLGTSAPVTRDSTATTPMIYKIKATNTAIGASAITAGASGQMIGDGSEIYADPNSNLIADLSSATAATVADLRNALGLQKYAEARAIYGDDYVDYLRYLGVTPSDARIDRPVYLGGGKQTLAFSEILNTTGANTPGAMVGHGIGAVRSNKFRYYCEEHGFIISMLSLRPKSIYVNGLHRKFSRADKEDYYTKELEGVGVQSILNKELAADHTTPNGVFGYSGRYDEYRSEPSRVSAEFRNTTNYDWHLGRILSDPALNKSFLECTPTKRVFADQTEDSCWITVNNRIVAKRMVSKTSWTGI